MTHLVQRPLTEVLDALARKRISAVELMQETLARIDERNPRLNAVVAVADRDALLARLPAEEAADLSVGTDRENLRHDSLFSRCMMARSGRRFHSAPE